MDALIEEAATIKASNLILKNAILDERDKFEKACNLLVAQKETFKRETLSSLEPVHVKKDLNLILADYHSKFLSYYSIGNIDSETSLESKLKFQIQILENSTLKVNAEIIQVLHAIIKNLGEKSKHLVLNFLLSNLRISWIRKILAEKGIGSHPLISSLSFVLLTVSDLEGYTQNRKGTYRALKIDMKSVLADAKNAQKLHDLSVQVQLLDAELLELKGHRLKVT